MELFFPITVFSAAPSPFSHSLLTPWADLITFWVILVGKADQSQLEIHHGILWSGEQRDQTSSADMVLFQV